MRLLLGLEPFQKLGVGGGEATAYVVKSHSLCGGGQKAFQSSALVRTLDFELNSLTKLNIKNTHF